MANQIEGQSNNLTGEVRTDIKQITITEIHQEAVVGSAGSVVELDPRIALENGSKNTQSIKKAPEEPNLFLSGKTGNPITNETARKWLKKLEKEEKLQKNREKLANTLVEFGKFKTLGIEAREIRKYFTSEEKRQSLFKSQADKEARTLELEKNREANEAKKKTAQEAEITEHKAVQETDSVDLLQEEQAVRYDAAMKNKSNATQQAETTSEVPQSPDMNPEMQKVRYSATMKNGTTMTQHKENIREKPAWQIKDEEYARRWKLAFSKTEKPTAGVEESKTEPKTETKQEVEINTGDSQTEVFVSKRAGPDVLPGTLRKERLDKIEAEMEAERRAKELPKKHSISSITVEDTVRILEKINKDREAGKFRKETVRDTIRKAEDKPKSEISEEEFNKWYQGELEKENKENETKKKTNISILERQLNDFKNNKMQKFEEKLLNEGIEKEEMEKQAQIKIIADLQAEAARHLAAQKAQAERELTAQKAEAERKIADAKTEGEKIGKEKLWAEFNRKRSWRENVKNFFSRHKNSATDQEKVDKYRADLIRTSLYGGVAVGAATTLATWAILQNLGIFLPVPIDNLKIHVK